MGWEQRGALLVAAVVLIVVITLLITVMSFLLITNLGSGGNHMRSAQALFLAEAGLERATFQFGRLATACGALTNTNVALGPGTFDTSAILYAPFSTTLSVAVLGLPVPDTVIPVASIAGLAPYGRIRVELEEIDYPATSSSAAVCGTAPCLINVRRGANGTTVAAHAITTTVYMDQHCRVTAIGRVGPVQRTLEAVIR